MIGCDFCPSSYHPGCLNLGPPELKLVLALSHWKCPECIGGTNSVAVPSTKSLPGSENVSATPVNLKRRAELARVEVKVAKLQLSMKDKALVREKALLVKEKALVKEERGLAMLEEEEEDNDGRVRGKTENIIPEEGEEDEKGRQRLQEQVRQCCDEQ